ncbi:sulfur carrier protein ThiS adenylyltransferase ThiF [Clostridium cylindrosporum]|uniref:sulfur carrier protein ThiS adenylyltransferase ThiF n=1 Tax=Clostridium cylindrosporum TaxID=1495 RepID=UPI00065C6BFA|nr:sulfur carrier protein ThiS adenylyltransferase ThiF [Clostridium cylindrosporum]
MKIKVNELYVEADSNDTAFSIRNKYKKDSDVIVLNGFQIKEDVPLKEADRVTLIKKGEIPTEKELENLMIARHTPGVFEKLKKSKVGVAGAGGLGSNIAISLARMGVGEIVICDYDVVEPSNLNRQQYFIDDIGKLKVEAIRDILKKINPFMNITIHKLYLDKSNIKSVFNDCNIILEAFDCPICKSTLSNEVLTKMKDTYLIASSGMAGYYSSNLIQTKKITSKFYLCGDGVNGAKEGSGLMAPRVAICANHMVNMVVRILCEEIDV